jgi:hypothetical protein
LEIAIAQGGLGRRRPAGYRRRARRHDDHGMRAIVRHRLIDVVLVAGAIAGEQRHRTGHPTQGGDPGGILHIVRGRGPARTTEVGIAVDVLNRMLARPRKSRPSRPPSRYAISARSGVPWCRAIRRHRRASIRCCPQYIYAFSTGAERARGATSVPARLPPVIKTEKAGDRADKTFVLAKREAKHCSKRRYRQNGDRRIRADCPGRSLARRSRRQSPPR